MRLTQLYRIIHNSLTIDFFFQMKIREIKDWNSKTIKYLVFNHAHSII